MELRPGRGAPPGVAPGGVVTAWNPASQQRTAEQNRRADASLRARLRALGLTARRALAHGVQGAEWDEPGWLIQGTDLATLVSLGREFGQNAVLWIDSAGAVRIVASRDGFCGVAAGTALG